MRSSDEILTGVLFTATAFVLSFAIGYIAATKSFINDYYGKEFIVIEKTIKKDGFSYNIVGDSYSHILNTKDDLEINTRITIGAK